MSGGYLYACGSHSGLSYPSTKKYFANGLVVKMNLSGNLVAYKTFGDVKRNSSLKHIAMESNGNLVCVGESGENPGNYKLKWSGWFLKTDMSSSEGPKTLLVTQQDEEVLCQGIDAENIAVPKAGE